MRYFHTPPLFSGPAGGDFIGISRRSWCNTKLEWMGYSVVKKAWQYIQPFWYSTSVWRTDGWTDGRTDERTDVQPISITCFSIADARKNPMNNSINLINYILKFETSHVKDCDVKCWLDWWLELRITHAIECIWLFEQRFEYWISRSSTQ